MTTPTVTTVTAFSNTSDIGAGQVVTLTVDLSEPVTVDTTNGIPFLTLNDGGTASYVSGSGTDALVFSYAVAPGDNASQLEVTGSSLNSGTIQDQSGNPADLTGAVGVLVNAPQIDTDTPTVNQVTFSPASAEVTAGETVSTTLTFSESVSVNNTTPTLTLSDGETATYVSGSGTDALTFNYTVMPGDTTPQLAVTGLATGTITDGAGNAADLTGAMGVLSGAPTIDGSGNISGFPIVSSVTVTPSSAELGAGQTVMFTLTLSEFVTVDITNGVPTLTLNDGETATYVSGSTTNALVFTYTVAPGDNTPQLAVTGTALNGATIQDASGNPADLSAAAGVPAGAPQIDTTAPTVTSVAASGDVQGTVTLTVTFSEAVTVVGTPTLTLNDGQTATYQSGSGNTLLFSYTVLPGDTTPELAVTGSNLNGGTIQDAAGNTADLTGAIRTPSGATSIDGNAADPNSPLVTSVTASSPSADLDAGQVVTLTVNFGDTVTVDTTNGTPTLTLNDGEAASYASGSGTDALVFTYTVAPGDNTPQLAITGTALNGGTIQNGNDAADLSGADVIPTGAPAIDTTTPTVTSVTASATSADVGAGQVVTLTVNLSEAVTVTGGTPILQLNDGGSATYQSGSGTDALVFNYTVAVGDNTPQLLVTDLDLAGATIQDGAGNAADLSLAAGIPTDAPLIDGVSPTVSTVTVSAASPLGAGDVAALTINLTEAVTVAGGTPTLTLNDGETASYVSGSGTNALVFDYTVVAGDTTPQLAVTGSGLNGATILDAAGNAADLSGAIGIPPNAPLIDASGEVLGSPFVTAVSATATSDDLGIGQRVTLTVSLNETVTVDTASGTPTLTLNDGGTASFVSGSGTDALVFRYTVEPGDSTSELAVTGTALNGATIQDVASNPADLSAAATLSMSNALQIDTTTPTVTSVTAASPSDDLAAGQTVTFTVNFSETVTVNTVGGLPTLTLNDGGVATYASGSGNALTFSYTVGSTDADTPQLAVTGSDLNGATIEDGAGNEADLSLAIGIPTGAPQIDTRTPTVSAVTATSSSADLDASQVVTLTVGFTEPVQVNLTGTPTLTLNDGGTASYVSGAGSDELVFTYTVQPGENTPQLEVTGSNLNGGAILNGAGTPADLTGVTATLVNSPQIDTTAPTVNSVAVSPTSADVGASQTVILTVTFDKTVLVDQSGGTPTLTLSDGETASYQSGSDTTALTFSYTVTPGDTTPELAVTGSNLNGGTIQDLAGNPADLTGAVLTPLGAPQIDGNVLAGDSPTVTAVTAGASSNDLDAGQGVILTVNLTEAVWITGTGTPTLTLNDGGTASYVSGSGSNALTFTYTVAPGDNTPQLAVIGTALNGAILEDANGNPADLSPAAGAPADAPMIDTTAPTVAAVTAQSPSNDLDAGKVVVLTVTFSENVTVNTAGGSPTLTLNDGETASYVSGSGSDVLVFSYTVAPGDNTPQLRVTGSDLNGGTIQDLAGNPADLTGAAVTPTNAPQIDANPPTVSSVTISPSSGDLLTGQAVTLMVNLSEAVTVNTLDGAPSLMLSDGETASYASGSGTTALEFTYTVVSGDTTPALAVLGSDLNGATILDGAGNEADLTGAIGAPTDGPLIDASGANENSPTVSMVTAAANANDFDAGQVVTLTVNLSGPIFNTGSGTPTLTLNDGGTATYASGFDSSSLMFDYTVLAGQNTSQLQVTGTALNGAILKDTNANPADLSAAAGLPGGVSLQIDTTPPTVTSVVAAATSDDLNAGQVVSLTVTFSEDVTVGGTPTLALNDGGTATYQSGSGSAALVFTYTVGSADTDTPQLAIMSSTLGGGGTIMDGAGNPADLTGALVIPANAPRIDTTAPTVTSVTETPGDFTVGQTVTLTLNLSEAVTVNTDAGTPTLTLNDGETAIYVSGSNSNALVFTYIVQPGDNTPALGVTASDLNGAVIQDLAGNAADLSLAVVIPSGAPQIDTTTPVVTGVTATGAGITNGTGDVGAGETITLAVAFNEAVIVAGGTPTLTLNDNATATYVSGSNSDTLIFTYMVGSGQNTASLAVAGIDLNGATIQDGAGNVAILTGPYVNPPGTLRIDTIAPTVASVSTSGAGIINGSGDLDAGGRVTLTATFSEPVIVTGGTPTLALNDGGTATYVSGSNSDTLVFTYTVGSGQTTAGLAVTTTHLNGATIQDTAGNNAVLGGLDVEPPGTLQIDTTAPTVSAVAVSGAGITNGSGDLDAGSTVTLTASFDEAVTVAGGIPTLTLNDSGTATYAGGSGTDALTFTYTVGSDQNTTSLAVTATSLNGATIQDAAGNNAVLIGLDLTPPGTLQIDTTTPAVTGVTATGAGITNGSGDLDAGGTVTLTATFNEAVIVAGGVPTLTLNDSGTATYAGGSGSDTLTFTYTVGSDQNTASLAVTGSTLNGATIQDGAGNAADLTAFAVNPPGTLRIDTTTPTVTGVTATGSGITDGSGDLNAGKTVTLTATFNEPVTVTGGAPTLTLNDDGTATYAGGSGTDTLAFTYTVGGNQNIGSLAVTGFSLNDATIQDNAGNAAVLTGLAVNLPGTLQIDTTTPTVTEVTATGSGIGIFGSGDLDAGHTVTLTATFNEAVNITGGTPTLTLNDGGTATYVSGSNSNTLVFAYTVGANQNTANLAVTAANLNGATIKDEAGNVAVLTVPNLHSLGTLQIDTTTPTVSGVTAMGAGITDGSGDLTTGQTATLTATFSEAVNVSGGPPTLTLNDGGTATYASGTGTNALLFDYTVGSNQNTASLAVTAANLNGGTIKDGAGNTAVLTGFDVNPPGTLQIETATPSVTTVTATGPGITNGSGDLNASGTVTLTATFTEAVTVAGGIPTLTLNDGGRATYSGGSGTDALAFIYTVGADQNTSSLAVTGSNLNGATIQDGAGNNAVLAGLDVNPSGTLRIDTTTPAVTSVTASPSSAVLGADAIIALTVGMSEAVNVNTTGGTPTLTLNDGGTATYVSGSGSDALTFDYTVAGGQTTADLAVTGASLNGATVADAAGNAADLAGAAIPLPGTLAIEPAAIAAFNTSTDQSVPVVAEAYTGPVAGLQNEYINITGVNLDVSVATPNWFLHGGSGNDALAVTSGNNVLDGGGGSNFLTGGTGSDTFFVDSRGATAAVWSTIVNFHAGDALTVWGVTPADFNFGFENSQGAAGYTGLTIHMTAPGSPVISATFAGLTLADLTNGTITESSGTVGGSAYTYFHANT